MKSNRSRIVLVSATIFVCLCLASLGIAGFISFRNRPPSSVTSLSGYYVRGSKVYYLGGFPSTAFEIGANASSFKIIDSSYALDDTHVYFGGNSIPDADPATFELLAAPLSRDVRRVYAGGNIFSDDTAHFEILGEDITRDSQHAYWSDSIISDDPSHIVVLETQNYHTYLHDSTTVFINGNPIPDADPLTFEIISDAYSRDASNIFYFDENIPDADPATFRVLNADFECSADAKFTYYQDQVIQNFDASTLPDDVQVNNCSATELYTNP